MDSTINYIPFFWGLIGLIGYFYISLQIVAFRIAKLSNQSIHVTLLKSLVLGLLIVFEIKRMFTIQKQSKVIY
ncbi:hypothetical protein EAY46_15405 [Vibrio anguillarum]|uniref:Uncharacterized protein n=1 Tax=Vibrio anguillarum TaxID=55601 RepID=A0ABR9Z9Q8_VIBAN|nr:hypothetical protein [Vibrio anguillarum]